MYKIFYKYWYKIRVIVSANFQFLSQCEELTCDFCVTIWKKTCGRIQLMYMCHLQSSVLYCQQETWSEFRIQDEFTCTRAHACTHADTDTDTDTHTHTHTLIYNDL